MGRASKTIRYGKPCMTNLPPELGRRIFDYILHAPSFDYTQLKRDCARINRQLAKISEGMRNDSIAGK